MSVYPKSIDDLIQQLAKLPTIGKKSARRLALKIVDMDEKEIRQLAEALLEVKEKVHPCSRCGNLTDQDICAICADETRDHRTCLVVEDSNNVFNLEKSKQYHGVYHVLGGLISPRDNITPDDINFPKLLERIAHNEFDEVILSISPTVDGDLTKNFLVQMLKNKNVKVTQIAMGVPMGVNLEYYDEFSLYRAIEDRREI